MLKKYSEDFEISKLEIALENITCCRKLRTFILVNNKPKFKYVLDMCVLCTIVSNDILAQKFVNMF